MPKRRLLALALLAAAVGGTAGCTAWQTRNWDVSQLRDPRATALDRRLTAPVPIGESPFSEADGKADAL